MWLVTLVLTASYEAIALMQLMQSREAHVALMVLGHSESRNKELRKWWNEEMGKWESSVLRTCRQVNQCSLES